MQPTPHDDLTCPNYREVVALRKRVQELEEERDDYRSKAIERQLRLEESANACAKLQADLDAALVLCCESDWDVKVLGAGYEPEVYKAHAHVLTMLEKRREENRG